MRDTSFFVPREPIVWVSLMRAFGVCRWPHMTDTIAALRSGRRFPTAWPNGWLVTVRAFALEAAANA